MKGFNEFRGHIFKQEFDPSTKQFVTKTIAPLLSTANAKTALTKKVVRWRKRQAIKKSQITAHRQIQSMAPELLDDIGMSEASVAALLL